MLLLNIRPDVDKHIALSKPLSEMGGVASFVNNSISKIANFDLCKVNALTYVSRGHR